MWRPGQSLSALICVLCWKLEAFEGVWHPDPEDVAMNIVPEDSWLPWLISTSVVKHGSIAPA